MTLNDIKGLSSKERAILHHAAIEIDSCLSSIRNTIIDIKNDIGTSKIISDLESAINDLMWDCLYLEDAINNAKNIIHDIYSIREYIKE